MRLVPAAQNKSPPNESTIIQEKGGRCMYMFFFFIPLCVRKWKDERKDEKGAPPSRGPRPFARNIRKFVGPPS